MKKKILSLLLALVMALSLVPTSVLAAPDDLGKAHVIVENTTFTKPVDGKAPAWTGNAGGYLGEAHRGFHHDELCHRGAEGRGIYPDRR